MEGPGMSAETHFGAEAWTLPVGPIFSSKFILWVMANSLYNDPYGSDGAMGKGGNG